MVEDHDQFPRTNQSAPSADNVKVAAPTGRDDWHRKYADRLIERGGLTEEQALDALDANIDDLDYSTDPVEAADEEMSYWA